jgi:hypothetical protein
MNRQRGANCFHGIKSVCGISDLIWIYRNDWNDRKADEIIRTKRRHDLTAGTVDKLEQSEWLEQGELTGGTIGMTGTKGIDRWNNRNDWNNGNWQVEQSEWLEQGELTGGTIGMTGTRGIDRWNNRNDWNKGNWQESSSHQNAVQYHGNIVRCTDKQINL